MASCVLFSGGMDSYLTWRLAAPEAALVFVDIGQKYIDKEYKAAKKIGNDHLHEIVATQIAEFEMPSGIILHRNALLILSAALFYDDIMMGVVADEINSDKSHEFFAAMTNVLNISHKPQYWNNNIGVTYRVHSPLRNMTKTEAVGKYLIETDNEIEPLLATISCYDADKIHCGACPSCFKRWVALVNNHLDDLQAFKELPWQWAQKQGIIAKALDGTYGKARASEILSALKMVGVSP